MILLLIYLFLDLSQHNLTAEDYFEKFFEFIETPNSQAMYASDISLQNLQFNAPDLDSGMFQTKLNRIKNDVEMDMNGYGIITKTYLASSTYAFFPWFKNLFYMI